MRNTHKRREIIFVSLIVLSAALVRVPSLTQPLGPDQGVMAVIGEGILHGGLPYRDYWEMGSPAIFFTYALMFKIFGLSMAAIPITDTLVSMLTTFLVFILARSIWDRKVGYISALLFAFFSNGARLGMHAGGDIAFGTFWYIAQRETFMLPLIVASLYCLLTSIKNDTNLWGLALSGFLGGLAFVYKFPAALILICLPIYLNANNLLTQSRRPWRRLAATNGSLLCGFVLSIAPFALFFFTKGAMNEMINVIFKYVYSVYGQLDHNYLAITKMGLTRTIFLAKENFVLWIFLITSSIYIIKNDRSREHLFMVMWALASLLFIISHREFFGYHYLMILPPFSILAGYGIVRALGTHSNPHKLPLDNFGKVFIILALCANLAFFATINYMHYTKFYYYLSGKIDKDTYYSYFSAYPKHDYSFPADHKVAQYILEHTHSEDMIYSLGGIDSVIYFLTKRRSPSRFIFSWIIFSDSHGQVKQAADYRKELLLDLKTRKPKYIIIVPSLETFKPYQDIYHFVRNNYMLEGTFSDDRFVYVLNEYREHSV